MQLPLRALALLAPLSAPLFAQDLEQPLVGSDTAAADHFGSALAIDGTTLVVGAADHDAAGGDAGAAYVFTYAAGTWAEQQKLVDPSIDSIDRFGTSVAVDGDTLAVGATLDEDDDGDNVGAVYVFERTGTTWSRTARLFDNSQSSAVEFGYAVAVDGGRMVTSAHETSGGGTVYVYDRGGAGWTQAFTLQAFDAGAGDDFGFALAADAGWIVVGAPNHDAAGGNAGAAYVYDAAGQFVQKLLPSGPSPAAAEFGYSVALDGDLLVVGAGSENTTAGSDAGAAYVYRESGGTWTEEARLVAPSTEPSVTSDLFGRAVAVSAGRVLVGAERASNDEGRGYLYTRDAGGWRIASVFTAGDVVGSDRAGDAVALSATTAVLGIYSADDAGTSSGRASAFDLSGGLLGGRVPVDLSDGGTQYLTVDAGPGAAGLLYGVLGTVSGTTPGFVLHGVAIPLNPDTYFLQTVTAPNAPPLSGTFGVLDAGGRGYARVDLPPGTDPSLAGLTVDHAAVLINASLRVQAASRPVPTVLEQ